MFNRQRDYRAIKHSGLFDPDYYLLNYPDVRRADVDSLKHFVKYGWKEGRNPSKDFDINFYLNTYPDVKNAGINPLFHYIRYGKSAGYKTHLDQLIASDNTECSFFQNHIIKSDRSTLNILHLKQYGNLLVRGINILFKQGPTALSKKIVRHNENKLNLIEAKREIGISIDQPKISIIIPVYNLCSLTQQCIESIYRETKSESIEVIVIDNASEDQTFEWLNSEKIKHPFFKVFRMDQNIGFGAAVNFGIRKSNGNFIVILNNDTIVSPRWLENLLNNLEKDPSIGIISPVTNYVGEGPQIDINAANLSPDIELIQKYALSIQTRTKLISEPNRLVFFCVMIRREVIDIIGDLDIAYEKGNFEDDDYCMRTRLVGYQLAIAQNSFVYHMGSATFIKNKISHDNYMEQNRIRFYKKAGRLATSIRKIQSDSTGRDIEVSVVVRTKNRPVLLEKALNSLANQTYKNFEVVLINDGGSDIYELIRKYNNLLLINYIHNETSRGRSAAANIGIDLSQGNQITFLDDDDIVYPWHLETLIQAANRFSSGFVYSNYNRSLILTENTSNPDIIKGGLVWEYNELELLINNYLPIHTWLVSKECVQQVGKFDENLDRLEDYDFLLRVNNITPFCHTSKVTCEYRYYLHSANSIYTEREKSKDALQIIYERYPSDNKDVLSKRKEVMQAFDYQIMKIKEIEKKTGVTMTEFEARREIIRLVTGL